jgi:hypothetical protein
MEKPQMPQMPRLLKAVEFRQLSRSQLHEMAVEHMTAEFDRRGEVTATWAIATASHVAWFETPWEDEEEKDLHVQAMACLMHALGVRAYTFASEMWVSLKTDDPELLPQLRDYVLLVATYDRHGGFDGTRFLVTVRQPVGPNFLGPRDDDTLRETRIAGSIWNILNAGS